MSDLLSRDATDQLTALRQGQVSAADLLELELARYEAEHGRINAVVARDIERARAEAAAIDVARARMKPLGLLAGLPMTVKDTYDVAGLPASGGALAYTGRDAPDAVMVQRLRAEGAVIWGKTNVPVMAGDWQSYNALYGTTNNPWDLTRTPGGSSGGSAAMLATQATALEIGSDIAGSLRVPAAFCGVFAHKPTLNLLSKRGHVPPLGALSPGDLTVMGPMARSVRDLALLLHVMSGGQTPAEIAPAAAAALKVGLWLDDPAMVLDPAVRGAITAFADRARKSGVAISVIPSPLDAERLLWTYNFLLMAHLAGGFPDRAYEAWTSRRPWAAEEIAKGAGPLSYAASILAATASHREWMAADETRHQLKARMAEVFETWDVIVTPVTPVEPFRHDHGDFHRRTLTQSDGKVIDYAAMKTWVALATALGLPATSIPAGLSEGGLPVGIQVIGPEHADAKTLAAAALLEQAAGGYLAPPPA